MRKASKTPTQEIIERIRRYIAEHLRDAADVLGTPPPAQHRRELLMTGTELPRDLATPRDPFAQGRQGSTASSPVSRASSARRMRRFSSGSCD